MILLQDTIAAIATSAGGGIGVIRLSGPEALMISLRHFRGLPSPPEPRRAYHGWWHDGQGQDLDEGLLIVMPGPRSYTGEDVVEVQLHGGALGLQRAVEVCFRAGARPAEPGEFTRRAFLNGRIDLTRAEAIADLVDAQTDQALHAARTHLSGELATACLDTRDRILTLRARLEVTIDFVAEDVPVIDPAELAAEAEAIAKTIGELAGTYRAGCLWRQGARVVLAGPPNAGKSSLFNALCGHRRAIVTDTPGTTRDTLEATIDMMGIPVVIVDTAGLRQTSDPAESEGVQRARQAMDEADLTLLLTDGESPVPTPSASVLLVASKSDLGGPPPPDALAVSAVTGDGLDALVDGIVQRLGGRLESGDRLVITRARHHAALLRAHEGLSAASKGLLAGAPPELAAVDITEATDALGSLVGLTTIEDVLDRLFGAFCIGK